MFTVLTIDYYTALNLYEWGHWVVLSVWALGTLFGYGVLLPHISLSVCILNGAIFGAVLDGQTHHKLAQKGACFWAIILGLLTLAVGPHLDVPGMFAFHQLSREMVVLIAFEMAVLGALGGFMGGTIGRSMLKRFERM